MHEKHVHEALATLYLRLNGYFTSGFIVHAPQEPPEESVRTEIDILAVRFPQNREPERVVEPSEYLRVSSLLTDILIVEVKSRHQPVQFNEPLLDSDNMRYVLRWVGAFSDDEIDELAPELVRKMQPKDLCTPHEYLEVSGPRDIRVRPILFHMGHQEPRRNQRRFIGQKVLMDFIWECLDPTTQRPQSRTVYDFGLWGGVLQPVVEYFKSRTEQGSVDEVVKYVQAYFSGEPKKNE